MIRLIGICFVLVFIAYVNTSFGQDDEIERDEREISSLNYYFNGGLLGEIVPFERIAVNELVFRRNEQRLQIATKLNNPRGIAVSSFNVACYHYVQGDKQKALANLKLALSARQKLNNPEKTALAHLHLGYVQVKAKAIVEGIKNYDAAIALLSEGMHIQAVAFSMAAKGQALELMKDYDAALATYNTALKGFQDVKDYKAVLNLKNRIGEVKLQQNDLEAAVADFEFCLNYLEESKVPHARALVLRNLGIAAFKSANYNDASNFFEQSLELQYDRRVQKLLRDTYFKLSVADSSNSDLEKRRRYAELYSKVQDSIVSAKPDEPLSANDALEEIEKSEKVQSLVESKDESKYKNLSKEELQAERKRVDAELRQLNEFSESDLYNLDRQQLALLEQERMAQIEKLNKEKALQELALSGIELELSRKTKARNFLFGGASLMLITSFFLFNRSRLRKKSLQKLDAAYVELSETHSRLKAAQDNLVHTQKMASLGQITAGIAHEIQNPLNFITNFSLISNELIADLKENNVDEEEKKVILKDLSINLNKIHEHGKRADDIVKSMLKFSRTGDAEVRDVHLHQLIDQYIELAYHSTLTNYPDLQCKIIKDYDEHIGVIKAIPQDLGRVFLNLFDNALYALIEKGKTEEFEACLKINTSLSLENEKISIRIHDNGTGIKNEILDKVFLPFFTTKPPGKGTGLGLSLSYDIIVKGHAGAFNIHSEEGNYSEFEIILPVYGAYVTNRVES